MNQERYTLEWRGARKGPWTINEIEHLLSEGDIHSLHKIQVNGRWLVLRDFLEGQRTQVRRAAAAEKAAAAMAAASYAAAPPPQHVASYAAHEPDDSEQQASFSTAAPSYDKRRNKSIGLVPALILGGVIIAAIAIFAGYFLATMGRHETKPEVVAAIPSVPPVENKPEDKAVATKPAEDKPTVAMAEDKPAEAPPVVKPADTTPAVKPADTTPVVKPGDTLAVVKPGEPSPMVKPAETPPVVKPADTKPEEKPEVGKIKMYSLTGKEIFPTAILATATMDWNGDEQIAEDKKTDNDAVVKKNQIPLYGDENGWLGVDLEGVQSGAKVTIEISADGLMKTSKWQGVVNTVSKKGRIQILPKIMWDFEALTKTRQQHPVNINCSATIDGVACADATETCTLKSINDCPIYFKDKKGGAGSSLGFLLAAYVNENHPLVQDILREALACHIVDQFDGYQSGNATQVRLQVFSIWNALQRRGIKYGSIATTTPAEKVGNQSVRFLEQSMSSRQANCVDGTVLMASVLQKIGINSYLVLVPGHCFLAFDEVPNNAALPTGLETTALGANDLSALKDLGHLSSELNSKAYEASKQTYLIAEKYGKDKILENARNLQSGTDPQYEIVSIEAARERGIMPIPYTMDK